MYEFQWYTDGKTNIKIVEDENIPNGFYPGFSQKKRKKIDNKLESKFVRLEKRVELDLELKHVDKRIHDLVWKSFSPDIIYEKLKFSSFSDEFILNKCLRLLIIEKSLIFQLETMPAFYKTTFDSLNSLYTANPKLQKRQSTKTFLLDEIKNDIEAITILYGNEFINLFF